MANLFDDCEKCSGYPKSHKTAVSIHSIGYDRHITGALYAWVHPVQSYKVVKVCCNNLEFDILRSAKLPLFANICWHNVEVLGVKEFHGAEADKENKQLLAFNYTAYNQEEYTDDKESETVRLPEKAEKKKWKRDFKSLVRRLQWFQNIIEIEKKQQSMIGYQDQQGAKDED